MKQVAIVESPAKAKTISGYLGDDFLVTSSYGHIRDLPKKEMGIDIKKDFKPTYIIPERQQKTVNELKKILKGAEQVWLATDEDREGEAIAWHLAKALDLDSSKVKRIVFHEITETAIKNAVANPRSINKNLVDAQQGRRVLDRLVGYELSPILWKKIRIGLSAGRVQSVAVRLIVEREREILSHKAQAKFKISAILKNSAQFNASLERDISSLPEAKELFNNLSGAEFTVAKIERKDGIKTPPAPFTTSSLQQTVSNLLGYSVKRTMVVAQQLYEAGLITYMRTDSMAISESALKQANSYVNQNFGNEYSKVRRFATKSKLAQEAHEAIRPTDFNKADAGKDKSQSRLYKLIWQRALATQMSDAKISKTNVKIANNKNADIFSANGEITVFDGFLKVYQDRKIQDRLLPDLKEGQILNLINLLAEETLDKPKPRYSEASLVKKLEALGIGRPSTYAPTISTIQDRGYIEKGDIEGEAKKTSILELANGEIKESKRLIMYGSAKNKLYPTQIGEVVNDFLVKHFSDILDYSFTAKIEDEFDAIAEGKRSWQAVIKSFYGPFHKKIGKTADVSRKEATNMRHLGNDPKTGKPIYARIARYGPIIQVGETESEEKPQFFSIPKNLRFDQITLEEAKKLMTLPRKVGKTKTGEDIFANIGPFGPYLKAGQTNVSLKNHDPHKIKESQARKLIAAKVEENAKKVIQDFKDEKIQILNGPYGPYVTDNKRRKAIPKDTDAKKIDVKKALEILNSPSKNRPRKLT